MNSLSVRSVVRICENIPICLVGNKVDDKDRKVKPKHITFHRKKNLQYFDVSAFANYNIEKPFLWILKKLTGDPNLQLIEAPKIVRPEDIVDFEFILANEQELSDVNNNWIQDEDEDC